MGCFWGCSVASFWWESICGPNKDFGSRSKGTGASNRKRRFSHRDYFEISAEFYGMIWFHVTWLTIFAFPFLRRLGLLRGREAKVFRSDLESLSKVTVGGERFKARMPKSAFSLLVFLV